MKYLLSGGGTGGHINPILALAEELKYLEPNSAVVYVGERHSKFKSLTEGSRLIDEKFTVYSGKFRRYHGESVLNRIFDIVTIAKNFRDVVFVVIGFVQSYKILVKTKPDVVFLKGGYVGVPVGLASSLLHIPIVTHDSDAIPGLANKIVSRWTSIHATALEADYYKYPRNKIKTVGVLVEKNYQPVNDEIQRDYKKQLGLPENEQLVLITGGSSGAERLNRVVVKIISELLDKHRELRVVHQVGKEKQKVYGEFQHDRLQILEFMSPMYVYTGAADLIVTRAGANALAEFGIQGKACIVVPNPELTGGHQTKNAQILEGEGAVVVVEEDKLTDEKEGLLTKIASLISDDPKRRHLAENLQKYTIPNAANSLAQILINVPKDTSK